MSDTLTVLDVGHGNCSVLQIEGKLVVVDAGKGPYATLHLQSKQISEIELIIISHADEDHLAGLVGLLSSETVKIKQVALNADALKDSKLWRDVKALLQSAFNAGKIKVIIGIFRQNEAIWEDERGAAKIQVVAPSLSNVLSGPGGKDQGGGVLNSNSAAIVLKIIHRSGVSALLAADMESTTLEEMIICKVDISASILVYPHHGGLPGKQDASTFTSMLMNEVKPKVVLFSMGRDAHKNPRPEVISATLQVGTPKVCCTQLSKNCHGSPRLQDAAAISSSAGSSNGKACFGTIEIDLMTGVMDPKRVQSHDQFVETLESPMCIARVAPMPISPISIH